ncbi:MAG: DNA alkylation repair protein [Eubacteriales bacterium]|nr:DNA alkylation repair protein [Eubacteriales bacterium]
MSSIKERLISLAEPDYARFAASLLKKPGEENLSGSAARMLGVRLPALHKLAKQLSREDWRGSLEELFAAAEGGFEERMLLGFLIGNAKLTEAAVGTAQSGQYSKRERRGQEAISLEEQFALICRFIPRIDNWSLCDSFCACLKFAREYPAETWNFLQPLLQSDEEYAIRFGLVMILNYFITEEYIDRLFPIFDEIGHEGYYVKMANAWAISICYVRFPEKTTPYLDENRLDGFTYQKALQKIVESRCVSAEVKAKMRERKQNNEKRTANCREEGENK